jgi:transcriptional regulator with XRE-family HTH domain
VTKLRITSPRTKEDVGAVTRHERVSPRMPKKTDSPIGNAIRAARMAYPMTQTELASRIGVRPATISHIEAGLNVPYAVTLRDIAVALAVTTDELMGRTPKGALTDPALQKELRGLHRRLAHLETEVEKLRKRR